MSLSFHFNATSSFEATLPPTDVILSRHISLSFYRTRINYHYNFRSSGYRRDRCEISIHKGARHHCCEGAMTPCNQMKRGSTYSHRTYQNTKAGSHKTRMNKLLSLGRRQRFCHYHVHTENYFRIDTMSITETYNIKWMIENYDPLDYYRRIYRIRPSTALEPRSGAVISTPT